MKKILIILIMLLPSMAFAQPSIVFDEEVYDFAIVDGTRSLNYTFEFRNAGTEDLIILKLDAP